MDEKKDRILIFIPCLNAGKTITRVLEKTKKLDFPHDILIVDNDSSDNSLAVIKEYKKRTNMTNCMVIKNIRNLGYGGSQKLALWYGIYYDYDYEIVIHSDDQYPVEYSGKLLEKIKQTKSAMVFGSRIAHKKVKEIMPKWRYLGNSLLSGFDRWAYNVKFSEFHSEFKIYDLKFMSRIDFSKWNEIALFSIHSFVGIHSKKGKIKEIPIPCTYEKHAHHPPILDLMWYATYTFYRGMKYKIFRR